MGARLATFGSLLGRLAALATAFAAPGCGPADPCEGALVIEGLVAPAPLDCALTVDGDLVARPMLDTSDWPSARSGGVRYLATLRVTSRTPSCVGYRLDTVDVEILDMSGVPAPLGAAVVNPFRVAAEPIAPPAASADARALATIPIVHPVFAAALADAGSRSLSISVRARAVLPDGRTITTDEHRFPLELCAGCLHECRLDAAGTPVHEPSCRPGQDEVSAICF